MATGAAKWFLFPCDATLPDHPGAAGCQLAKLNFIHALTFTSFGNMKTQQSNSQNFCRGFTWLVSRVIFLSAHGHSGVVWKVLDGPLQQFKPKAPCHVFK